MSAAFTFHEFACWGTNGTIEAYLERLAELAAATPHTDLALIAWLGRKRVGFFSGAVVLLDEVVSDRTTAEQFLSLFERATTEFMAGDEFTAYGKEWLLSAPPQLCARIRAAFA